MMCHTKRRLGYIKITKIKYHNKVPYVIYDILTSIDTLQHNCELRKIHYTEKLAICLADLEKKIQIFRGTD